MLRYTSILKKFYVLIVKALYNLTNLQFNFKNQNENYVLGINLRYPVIYRRFLS
jgi:hypothetical protein